MRSEVSHRAHEEFHADALAVPQMTLRGGYAVDSYDVVPPPDPVLDELTDIALQKGHAADEVRTFAFLTLISANIAVILSNRSWTRSIFRILYAPNPTVKWVVGGAAVFTGLVVHVPFINRMFLFTELDFMEILICIATGLLSITGFEAYKWVIRFRGAPGHPG